MKFNVANYCKHLHKRTVVFWLSVMVIIHIGLIREIVTEWMRAKIDTKISSADTFLVARDRSIINKQNRNCSWTYRTRNKIADTATQSPWTISFSKLDVSQPENNQVEREREREILRQNCEKGKNSSASVLCICVRLFLISNHLFSSEFQSNFVYCWLRACLVEPIFYSVTVRVS